MLEGLSNPPVFNQSKLIYLQHTSGIDLYNMYIYARGKKKKKILFVCCNTSVISRIEALSGARRILFVPVPSHAHTTVFLHDKNCLHATFRLC